MDDTQSPEVDVETQERDKRIANALVTRKFWILTVTTMVVTTIVVVAVVSVLALISGASLLGGYLNSIPRIMERRETILAGTDSFYSRDFTIRGDVAALLYDGMEEEEPLERVLSVKDAVGAVGIALIDQDGNIVCDSETSVLDESLSGDSSKTEAVAASSDGSDSGLEEVSAVLDPENVEQVINSDEELIIINADATDAGPSTDRSQSGETDPGESSGEAAETDHGDAGPEAEGAKDMTADAVEADLAEGKSQEASGEASTPDVEDTGETEDVSLYVYYRAKVKDGLTLVIKFDPTTSLSINQAEGQWDKLLNKLVVGMHAYSFVREDSTGVWSGIGLSSLNSQERESVDRCVEMIDERVVFSIPFSAKKGLSDAHFGVIFLLGKPYLVVTHRFPERDLTFGIAAPFSEFFPGYLRSALALAAFAVLSITLLIVFIRVNRSGMPDEEDFDKQVADVRLQCRGGLVVVAVSLSVFTFAMIMLNTSATTARTARIQREALTFELSNQEMAIEQVEDEYREATITHATALARVISRRPQLRTRSSIKSLADIMGARYLMLFDKDGNELFSSNAYVGFRIGRDEEQSVESIVDVSGLQAMLLGESYVISDPVEDRQGNTYYIIGALVTDAEGLPDGFLVMAVDTPKTDTTYKEDLSALTNREDQVAMVVDDESGLILKHSDVSKVGEPVKTYLREEVLGFSYEGYTWYQNRQVYMSSTSNEGISTIILHMDAVQIEDMIGMATLIVLNTAVLASIFYPLATKFVCKRSKRPKATKISNPYIVFFYGYSFFICLLSIVARVSAFRGNWPTFALVFDGGWTKGMNEFSLWSAMFFTTQASTFLIFVKYVFGRITESLNLSSRTFVRLCESLITYASVIVIAIVDLTWFGIDTTALIASAGIVSIAVGMGAKDLIADILAGMFIIFESSVHMGDIVEIGTWRGTVTDIGVRTCEITDSNNNVKVVNNSHINELVNFSRKSTSCTLEFEMSRDVDVEDVPEVVEGYIKSIVKAVPEVAGSLHFLGITSITDKNYRVKLGWLCDESKRENLTFKLNNAVRLIQERSVRTAREADALKGSGETDR